MPPTDLHRESVGVVLGKVGDGVSAPADQQGLKFRRGLRASSIVEGLRTEIVPLCNIRYLLEDNLRSGITFPEIDPLMVLPKLLAFLPMRPTVYIETSVVSYLTARPSRDLIVAGHQQVTADWWAEVLPSVAAFVSELVLEEAAKGDENAAAQRLARIEVFPVLEAVGEVDGLGFQTPILCTPEELMEV